MQEARGSCCLQQEHVTLLATVEALRLRFNGLGVGGTTTPGEDELCADKCPAGGVCFPIKNACERAPGVPGDMLPKGTIAALGAPPPQIDSASSTNPRLDGRSATGAMAQFTQKGGLVSITVAACGRRRSIRAMHRLSQMATDDLYLLLFIVCVLLLCFV